MILYEYPITTQIKDGKLVTLRPLRKSDKDALLDYFRKLPPEERMCLKDDVTDEKVIERWIYDLDYDVVTPVVALDNGRIVASATLHANPIGWTSHQGEVRITCDLEYRKQGLATILIENLIDIAQDFGMEQLTAQVVPQLHQAYFLFEKLGFKEAGVLPGFVKDMKDNYDNLVLMVLDIRRQPGILN